MSLKFLVLGFLFLGSIGGSHGGDLRKNCYQTSWPSAEDIINKIIWKRGCDASVLIDSTSNNSAIPNQSLGGFNVIDEIKAKLETTCPGLVSCADILALAARDAVSYQFQKPMWEVLTGRRDGTVFQLHYTHTVHDLVVLSGGHTIGVGHCNFCNRLYNFTGTGDSNPSLHPTNAAFLKTQCPSLSDTITTVEMDPGNILSFDCHYYAAVKEKKGMFQSDAALLTNEQASGIVDELVDKEDFFTEFGQSMKRMGAIQVLTGREGEIRDKCNGVNS